MKNLKLLVSSAILAVSALGGVAIAQERTLVVGTGTTFRPFGFTTPDKKIVGFDIDVINAIAANQKFSVRFEGTPFSTFIPALENGDRDMYVGAVTITPARRERLDFSNPYAIGRLVLLTNPAVSVKSLDELKGRRVGVALNSTGDTAATQAFGKDSPNIRRFETTPLTLEELNQGGIDAFIGDVSVASFYQRANPEKRFRVVQDARFPQTFIGIAVKKGNTQLLNRLNAGLKNIVDSGEYARIYQKWFGTQPPALPASLPN